MRLVILFTRLRVN